jgi:hypothetical protein
MDRCPNYTAYGCLMVAVMVLIVVLAGCVSSQPPGGDLWIGVQHTEDGR